MVNTRVGFCNASQSEELCNQVALEIGALVGMYPRRETINTEHIIPKLPCDLLRCLIGTREGMSQFGVVVGDYQNINRPLLAVFGSPEIHAH